MVRANLRCAAGLRDFSCFLFSRIFFKKNRNLFGEEYFQFWLKAIGLTYNMKMSSRVSVNGCKKNVLVFTRLLGIFVGPMKYFFLFFYYLTRKDYMDVHSKIQLRHDMGIFFNFMSKTNDSSLEMKP